MNFTLLIDVFSAMNLSEKRYHFASAAGPSWNKSNAFKRVLSGETHESVPYFLLSKSKTRLVWPAFRRI